MHCIWRCACKLHGRHLTTCHVQDPFFFYFFTPVSFLGDKRRALITSAHQPDCHTSITHPPSGSQGRGHTDSPDRRPGSAAVSIRACLSWAALPALLPGKRLSVRTHRPDVAVRSRPQLAWSVLLHIHPPPADGRDSYYISHAPTSKINKQSPCTSSRSSCNYVFSPLLSSPFSFSPAVGFRCTHPPLASARHPATHPPINPPSHYYRSAAWRHHAATNCFLIR